MSIEKKDLSKDDSGDESTGSSPRQRLSRITVRLRRTNSLSAKVDASQGTKAAQPSGSAAFRERRTEYIKQLEETIRVHEQNLHNLQTAHRHAADECLMLRYKNLF
ncbi:hypothetical protein GE09DRAFT_1295672 [Coniochaeta sp. 2T2.1]|nr:hypothetical protein GE09DRAFT_1295672 [Coniochaeta sp. 2T2.1]